MLHPRGKQGLADVDFLISIAILMVVTTLGIAWSIGEALKIESLVAIAKWGLGGFIILLEVIKAIIKGGLN